VSLDTATAARTYELRVASRTTPEDLFERSWAQTVFDRVLDQLEQKAGRRGREARMARLRPFLIGAETAGAYAEVAAEWRVGESAVRAAVHRFTQGLRRAPPRGGRRTVTNGAEVDDEVQHILTVLGR